MEMFNGRPLAPRYSVVPERKLGGATYTPKILSDFVAAQMLENFDQPGVNSSLRILDPAIGEGELLFSLLEQFGDHPEVRVEAYGFDTDSKALDIASQRLTQRFSCVEFHLYPESFLQFVVDHMGERRKNSRSDWTAPEAYDLIVANPPYVRTQIMGARQTQSLACQFGLSGRVDLYYAFILAIAQVLKPNGIAGIIVSNRFMTTQSGAPVRRMLLERFNLRHIWDLGDTKLFQAAVLPAVLVAEGRNGCRRSTPDFTCIYETDGPATAEETNPIRALLHTGIVQVGDGRRLLVQHGKLNADGAPGSVWRIATTAVDSWIATVKAHTWRTFGDIGKIHVGVKTCADAVFVRSDWRDVPDGECPELLRPLTTHHVARRFKAAVSAPSLQILYPYEVVQGRRHVVDLSLYPRSEAYLESHRAVLEHRKYVMESGRKWYEIWVPQDPAAWDKDKLVFRDIAVKPTFWIDQSGSVVNGDCYWIICRSPAQTDLLWLAAAVGNSRFIERFYDYRFHNKLYAGRRRFITQYVGVFPLPDPDTDIGKTIVARAKEIYACIPSLRAEALQGELEKLIWEAFGLVVEEVAG
jgi:SAM-dependent methyltransferase